MHPHHEPPLARRTFLADGCNSVNSNLIRSQSPSFFFFFAGLYSTNRVVQIFFHPYSCTNKVRTPFHFPADLLSPLLSPCRIKKKLFYFSPRPHYGTLRLSHIHNEKRLQRCRPPTTRAGSWSHPIIAFSDGLEVDGGHAASKQLWSIKPGGKTKYKGSPIPSQAPSPNALQLPPPLLAYPGNY